MANDRILLDTEQFYHIYNHAVHQNNLFLDEKDYHLFLARLKKYVCPISDIYAYCLMPNHYHILVKIKEFATLQDFFNLKNEIIQKNDFHISDNLTHQIGSFQNSYTKLINKKYKRKGTLFMQSFRRKLVEREAYLYKLVHYIHFNPVHHNFTNDINSWNYSSYLEILENKNNIVNAEKTMSLFVNKEDFTNFHYQKPDVRLISLMEDF
jgi:REP element-mobilizing transposase RayT